MSFKINDGLYLARTKKKKKKNTPDIHSCQ